MHAYYPCIYIYSYMTKYNNIHTIHISIICNPPKTQRPAASRRSPTSRRRWSLRSWRNWSMTPSSQRPHGCDAVRHGGSYTKLLPVLYNGYLWKYDMYNIWCIYIYVHIDVLTSFMCYEVTCFCNSLSQKTTSFFTVPLALQNLPWNVDHFRRGNLSRRSTYRSYVCYKLGLPSHVCWFRFTPWILFHGISLP